ncbi:hypothetical protein [uncultured Jatrophihabitans sp.]|uniref:hypothetical protein n=1 Tax=uncultured Jatrophihabitans sp. TaxID=1610747 RepID=UPI0035CC8419
MTDRRPPDDVPVCDRCGRQHLTRKGHQACTGHVGQNNDRDPGGPCIKDPIAGLEVCGSHGGGSTNAKAAARRRTAEARAAASLAKLVPDNPEPILDPIATLARLGGEADQVRRNIVDRLNKATDVDAVMAWSTKYQEFLALTGRFCEALVKSNYLERHAAIEEAQLTGVLAAVRDGLALIPDPDVRTEVTTEIVRRLRLLPGNAA